jgi:hypothetical protein
MVPGICTVFRNLFGTSLLSRMTVSILGSYICLFVPFFINYCFASNGFLPLTAMLVLLVETVLYFDIVLSNLR